MCVCVFFPFILDIKFVGRTSRGHTGGRSHRISHPPSFCGACLYFSREKDSAIPFSEFCVLTINNRSPPVGHFYFHFLVFSEKNPVCRDRTHVPTCQRLHGTSELPGRPVMLTVNWRGQNESTIHYVHDICRRLEFIEKYERI